MDDVKKAPPASMDSTAPVAPPPVAPAKPEGAPLRAFEDWARAKKTAAWEVAAAKAMHRWPVGKEMSEADYDKAIKDATTHTIR